MTHHSERSSHADPLPWVCNLHPNACREDARLARDPICGERATFPEWTGVSNAFCGLQANHNSLHRFWIEWLGEVKPQNPINSIVPPSEQYC